MNYVQWMNIMKYVSDKYDISTNNLGSSIMFGII